MSFICQRRSIRKYQEREVEPEKILELLKAAMCAPSAWNQQAWHFIVIRDKLKRQKIAEVHPYARMVSESPVCIIVCCELSLLKSEKFWPQDCSAATENILIRATELGLGSVWCGVYPDEERVDALKKLFNLPKNIIPFSIVAIGYPAEQPRPTEKFKPERIHYEGW